MLHGSEWHAEPKDGYTQEPTVPYHLATRLRKGPWGHEEVDFCIVPLLRAQPQGVVDLG